MCGWLKVDGKKEEEEEEEEATIKYESLGMRTKKRRKEQGKGEEGKKRRKVENCLALSSSPPLLVPSLSRLPSFWLPGPPLGGGGGKRREGSYSRKK